MASLRKSQEADAAGAEGTGEGVQVVPQAAGCGACGSGQAHGKAGGSPNEM